VAAPEVTFAPCTTISPRFYVERCRRREDGETSSDSTQSPNGHDGCVGHHSLFAVVNCPEPEDGLSVVHETLLNWDAADWNSDYGTQVNEWKILDEFLAKVLHTNYFSTN